MRTAVLTLVLSFCGSLGAAQSPATSAPDAASKSQSAARAMDQGHFDEAARIYQDLVQAMPGEGGLLMNLGMALAMGGHDAEAIAPLEKAVALKPQLIPAQLFLGSSYLALGRAADAVAPLKRAVAGRPSDVESRRLLAQAYADTGRPTDAVVQLRAVTDIAPKAPGGWYALGHAYNAVTQEAMSTFEIQPEDSPWRQLLVADALLADGRLTDSFALQRAALDRLPSMVSIHDSIAKIYELSQHPDWAATERAKGALSPAACVRRKALCEFRAGRFRAALTTALSGTDLESRYWRARAATELALAAFKQLEELPDSRERREVRATLALAQRRYTDAIAELTVALKFAPDDPGLRDDLGTAYYSSREFEKAVDTFTPLLKANPDDPRLLTLVGDSLLQLQRVDEAIPLLRRAVERDQSASMPRLALGRAYVQKGDFAAAIPLLEEQLARDHDGSLHVQLARAYSGLGQKDRAEALLAKSQELQQAAQERGAAAGQRTIGPPK
jgi:tetratricopeptide (TPR) repeat protein